MKRRPTKTESRPRVQQHALRLTRGGFFFILAATLICLGAMDGNVNLLTLLFGFCLAALLVNLFYGSRTLKTLSVRRCVPDVAVAGQPFLIRYTITNHRRWASARGILIEDCLSPGAPMPNPEVFVPFLPAGETINLAIPAVCPSRGRLAFSSFKVHSRLPFYLFTKWMRYSSEQEMIVFPALGRVLTRIRPGEASVDTPAVGSALGRIRGDEEYYGVREYRIGDNPRRIHWRRTAQTGQLMIREMARARDDQFWCVVHTRIAPDDPGQAERLELAISAAATVICDALERGSRVGLICNGRPLVVMPPSSGRACRPRLLRELAICTNTEADDDLAAHLRRLPWPPRRRGPALLFGAADTEDLRAVATAMACASGATTVYIPGTCPFDELFEPPDSPTYKLPALQEIQ